MCGIAGVISLKGKPIKVECAKKMCDVIAHRGPDDAGYFFAQSGRGNARGISYFCEFTDSKFKSISPLLPVIDSPEGWREVANENWDVFLGHRRLAVIDLTPAAHQPMSDKSKRIWLVYNGEIYNFKELRKELESIGYKFKSRSDTEVIIYSYIEWGIDCVKKFNGMFAFAIWDGDKKVLYLARDRYGIKPLYYTLINGETLVFASEIKAILQYDEYEKRINLSALNEYFTFQNLFRYETLFKDIFLLPPAHIAIVDFENGLRLKRYWDYNFAGENKELDFHKAELKILELLHRAVERQIVADVPVGSYLSGGMDSGSIAAITSKHIPRLTTFTAGFEVSKVTGVEATFDERKYAELVANEFKTQHFEQIINAGDIAWVMPELIWHMEELRVGMTYPHYYISRLASKFVKVCLSGAGGDELFGGYPWRYYRALSPMNKDEYFKNYYDFWQRLVKDEHKVELFTPDVWNEVKDENTFEIFKNVFAENKDLKFDTPENQIASSLYFEAKTFLHGLLIVGDKISMAHSLEERFPFLDNELADFAMKIPVRFKLKNIDKIIRIDENEVRRNIRYYRRYDDGKNILRSAMKHILPDEITSRDKQGFSPPDESWFRGENFQYVKEMLLGDDVKMFKYINKDFVRRIIEEHKSGINHRLLIWSFLSFEHWCRVFDM